MSDEISIIREAILGASGLGGVLRFNALYTGSFETEGGRPDLPAIEEAITHAFPRDQAVIIMTAVTKKLGGSPGAIMAAAQRAQQAGTSATAAGSPAGHEPEEESTFARYFNADPGHVRDIVNEARRLRLAMGKTIVVSPGQSAESPADTGVAASNASAVIPVEKTMERAVEKPVAAQDITTVELPVMSAPLKKPDADILSMPRAIAEPVSEIDREIEQFAYGRTTYSSIDILDFIRYLKDKGYSFEECIVLEKVYVKIEERKKEARSTIEKEVEGIFRSAQAPGEPDIIGLVRRLRETGLVFEEEDVRQMTRIAALRRASP